MSVLRTRQECTTRSKSDTGRVRLALVHELKELVRLAKERHISLTSLPSSLTKLELMVLDTAFKDLPLESADSTLLILPDKFDEMLQKLIVVVVQLLQN